MYISKLSIKNFKILKDVTVNFNKHFNIIIGKNNCGKSTIMESIRLWQLAFAKFLKESTKKASAKNDSSFYARQYFSFIAEDLDFLRIDDFKMLFSDYNKKKIEISITLMRDDKSVDLPIIFIKDSEEKKIKFELCENITKRKQASNDLCSLLGITRGSSLKNTLLISYVSPLFNITNKELKYTKGYILNLVRQSKSNEALRNILYEFTNDYGSKDTNKRSEILSIEKHLNTVLYGSDSEKTRMTFSRNFKIDKDPYIKIYASKVGETKGIEIGQLGSGTLNLLNILSSLAYGDYNKYNLNVLLLDEPDSHMHADIQKRLFEILYNTAKDNAKDNKQLFVITHNHELIEASTEVLYIDNVQKEINPIEKDNYYKVYKEIAPEFHRKMIDLSAAKSCIRKLTKPTLFVEGETDKNILEKAYKKLHNAELSDLIEVIAPGNGCSGITCNLKSMFKGDVIVIGLFDHDKPGIEQYKNLKKSLSVSSKDDNIESVLDSGNKHWFLLPIPQSRKDSADWFNENTCIEYLFEDSVLEKMEVNLVQKRGNTYKTIESSTGQLDDKVKNIVQNKLDELGTDDFENFRPIFDEINNILSQTKS